VNQISEEEEEEEGFNQLTAKWQKILF